jgi:diguanylate cyclase (GGDEF)-like protein/PAS domain S-box-containing protein
MENVVRSCESFDFLESGQFILGVDFTVYSWNRWISINTQIAKEEIIGKSLKDFFPDVNYATLARRIKTALILNSPSFYDSQNKKNYLIPIKREKISSAGLNLMQQQVTISPYNVSQNLVLISIYDMSELFETKLSLQHEINKANLLNVQLKAEQLIIDQNIMITHATSEGVITDVSSLLCETLGYEKSFLIGKNIQYLTQEKMPEAVLKSIFETVMNKQIWDGEIENVMSNGETKWTQVRITPILKADGTVGSYSAVYHDITNKKLLEELYVRDPLTQLYNRRYFDSLMDVVMEHQRKEDIDFALIISDIDHFKSINDTYGHQIGDEALRVFAATLKETLRQSDVVARWGGEEFVIMLRFVDVETAQKIAEKIRIAVENCTFNGNLKMTSSFGLTKYRPGENILESFKRVDDALYEAKRSGRNRVITSL